MSPVEYPPQCKDTTPLGSLFTLFLHCPIKAFCFICDITQSTTDTWKQALVLFEEAEKFISHLFDESEELGYKIIAFNLQINLIRDSFKMIFCYSFALDLC